MLAILARAVTVIVDKDKDIAPGDTIEEFKLLNAWELGNTLVLCTCPTLTKAQESRSQTKYLWELK